MSEGTMSGGTNFWVLLLVGFVSPRVLSRSLDVSVAPHLIRSSIFNDTSNSAARGPGRPKAHCHFNDPFAVPCMADESNVTITGIEGAICSSPCGPQKACPTDYCAGTTASSACALEDSGGNDFCALVCSSRLPITDQRSADAVCSSDTRMKCRALVPFGLGLCVYVE